MRRRDVVQQFDYNSSYHTKCGTLVGECILFKGWWCLRCQVFTNDVKVPVVTYINGKLQGAHR